MIHDSVIWKKELKKEIATFKKYLKDIFKDKYDQEHFVLGLEKFYFVCSFIVRKLNECKKLSDELISINYESSKYKRIDLKSKLDILNNHKFGSFYNLNKPENCRLGIVEICNMFIHSFIFCPTFSEDQKMKFTGVFINSDYLKEKYVYHLDYKTFLDALDTVIRDEILSLHLNRATGEIKKSKYNKIRIKNILSSKKTVLR